MYIHNLPWAAEWFLTIVFPWSTEKPHAEFQKKLKQNALQQDTALILSTNNL